MMRVMIEMIDNVSSSFSRSCVAIACVNALLSLICGSQHDFVDRAVRWLRDSKQDRVGYVFGVEKADGSEGLAIVDERLVLIGDVRGQLGYRSSWLN